MSKLSTKLELMLIRKVFHAAEVTQQGALLEGQSTRLHYYTDITTVINMFQNCAYYAEMFDCLIHQV